MAVECLRRVEACFPGHDSSFLSSNHQLPHCCPHLLGVRLPVASVEMGFAVSCYVFANAFGQRCSFLNSTGTHESVLAPQLGFYLMYIFWIT